MNEIIKFILILPILKRTIFIYKDLIAPDFIKLLTKFTLLLVFRYKKYIPTYKHIYNSKYKTKKYVNV